MKFKIIFSKGFRTVTLFVICLLTSTHSSDAQDGHYWNRNYGSTSTILGGAVIGANADLGSIYYNPAALAFRDSIKVSLSSSLHDLDFLTIRNGLADGYNTSSMTFESYPFTIIPSFKLSEKTNLGLVFLTRLSGLFEIHHLDTGNYDLLNNGNLCKFNAVFDYRNELSERWYGGSLSHKLNTNGSFGVGFYVGYRSHTIANSYTANGVVPQLGNDTANNYVATYISRFVHYYHYKAIIKVGYYHQSARLSFGITATLPCIPLYGSGRSSARYFFRYLPDSSTTGKPNDVLVFDEQDNIKAVNKYPATIGAGMTLNAGDWKLYASAEYFFGIRPYDVMMPQSTASVLPAEWIKLSSEQVIGVRTSAKAVLNAGIGFSYHLKRNKNILGSITTDFNSLPADKHFIGNSISANSWNTYHFSLGTRFKFWKIDVLTGLRYSTGHSKNQPQLVDMRSPTNDNLLLGNRDNNMEQVYRSLSLLLGFNF